MPVVLGKNISSLQAQRRLNDTAFALGKVYERLSSGQRINRASDDAAGLSISSTLSAKSRILNRAGQNLGDATSLLTIADSALGEVGNVLGRLAELAEQAANGTYSNAQRANLNNEFGALQKEIRRIANSTEFNGLALFKGTAPKVTISVQDDLVPNTSGLGVSSDGRFELYNSNTGFVIKDTDSGVIRNFDVSNIQTSSVQLSDSGDIVWRDSSSNDIYYYNYTSQTTKRVAAGVSGGVEPDAFTLSADGSTLVFASSRASYVDGGSGLNATSIAGSGSLGVYSLSLITGKVQLLETSTFNVNQIVVSADGSFAATQKADGSITTFDRRGSNLNKQTRNVGYSGFDMLGITTSGKLSFVSNSNLNGLNAGGGYRVYALDATNGNLSLAVNTTLASGITTYSGGGAISNNGRLITWMTNDDLLGKNQFGYFQIYQLDVETGTISQITDFQEADSLSGLYFSGAIRYASDGSKLVGLDSDDNQSKRLIFSNTSSTFDFEAGFGKTGRITAALDALFSSIRGLDSSDITGQFGGRNALYRINKNIESLATMRGVIGASMSRVQTAYNLTINQRDEILGARGRIIDADTAGEAAQLVRYQVSQQAAAAVLSQANQQPALAMQLLR